MQCAFEKRKINARLRFSQVFIFFIEPKCLTFPMNSALTDSQILLFSNFFIKNESHGTIHIFKNYFVTVFFSFQLYPNGPVTSIQNRGDCSLGKSRSASHQLDTSIQRQAWLDWRPRSLSELDLFPCWPAPIVSILAVGL